MNRLQIKGNWNDDLTFAEGREDGMLGRLQPQLGESKEEIRRTIEEP